MALKIVNRENAGFSLVELMVGMVLGLMLIAGAVSIYLASKRSYVEVEQVAALSENARFAQQLIGDSLRHAGFFGEVPANRVDKDPNLTAVVGDCDSPAAAGAYDLSRLGYAATVDGSGSALGCIDDAYVDPNDPLLNDVLVIKHALTQAYSDGPRIGKDPNDPFQNDGIIDTPTTLDPQKVYVMTNNVGGLIFDGNDTAPSITTGGQIPGGTAWEYQYEVFYIKDGAVPQLARKYLAWNGTALELETEEVVEGVERLRLLFGYDSDNDGEVDNYSNVAAMTASGNWANAQSVEVYMLVRSATEDVQHTDTKTYRLGDVTVTPGGNFRRLKSFSSVSLRNLKLVLRRDGT
jgi:type IV pilus assembly protein PilW